MANKKKSRDERRKDMIRIICLATVGVMLIATLAAAIMGNL